MLGSSLDELLRHVPRLRQEGVDVALQILRRLCLLGGDPSPPEPKPMPEPGAAGAAGAAGGEGESEEEDGAGEGGEAMDTDVRWVGGGAGGLWVG